MRYAICSPVTTAIATNAIDQTSSARAIPAAADEGKTQHGNENEDPEPLTERDPSNKANDHK